VELKTTLPFDAMPTKSPILYWSPVKLPTKEYMPGVGAVSKYQIGVLSLNSCHQQNLVRRSGYIAVIESGSVIIFNGRGIADVNGLCQPELLV
jgi:hypothetical protein